MSSVVERGMTPDLTRSRKLDFTRSVYAAGLSLLLSGWWAPLTLAADPPSAAATASTADQPAKEKPAKEAAKPDAAADADEKPVSKPPEKTPSRTSASPQRFEPSEQVRPDFDVSFPIDI